MDVNEWENLNQKKIIKLDKKCPIGDVSVWDNFFVLLGTFLFGTFFCPIGGHFCLELFCPFKKRP